MAEVNGNGSPKPTPFEEAMEALSTLPSERNRLNDKDVQFHWLFDYVKILDLEEALSKMRIIHVAGTKGKGSTCTFSESILRNCAFHTGLFTAPHIFNYRERFRLDGEEISEEKFVPYFWWCLNRLKAKTTELDIPMPPHFRFQVLLAFKIFAAEQVDVAVVEVGIGGKLDSTNVVQEPVVCGISSLGYDHMEILGNTLEEIAGHKAGIFKHGVPAFTVPQTEQAMRALEDMASQLNIPLQVVQPLDASLLNGVRLGLDGEHQYMNAGLAVALCSSWLRRTGHVEIVSLEHTNSLPEQFIKGLATAQLQGRAQIIPDCSINIKSPDDLVFYLDGAHTPESMEVCGRWFSDSVKDLSQDNFKYTQILVFSCMLVRDPHVLLARLMETCALHGLRFKKALFVPNTSTSAQGRPRSSSPSEVYQSSWQFALQTQRVWENLMQKNNSDDKTTNVVSEDLRDVREMCGESSAVFSSLPLAIKWLRNSTQQNQSLRFQVLVTGSLHTVAEMLALFKSETSNQS